MTNKTKAAIEEAAKLPTEWDLLNKIWHIINQQTEDEVMLSSEVQDEIEKHIESHTAAHTAALDKYNSVLIEEKQELRERVNELKAKIASYESAIDGLKKVVDSLYNLKS